MKTSGWSWVLARERLIPHWGYHALSGPEGRGSDRDTENLLPAFYLVLYLIEANLLAQRSLSVSLSVWQIYSSILFAVFPFVCPSPFPSSHLLIFLAISIFSAIYPSILTTYYSVCPSIHPSPFLLISLSVCPSISPFLLASLSISPPLIFLLVSFLFFASECRSQLSYSSDME